VRYSTLREAKKELEEERYWKILKDLRTVGRERKE
jgi:hypothetical protein